ncbi:M28 family peptidase [Rhizobium ruizarguesonis]|uniref:M28 family peptidase n=1 Tax=Rhizobium ruizarguesonis TaxID=2081791 RepID=UPI00163AEA22|nr:M28 family peptidase [Rhizobium ruizarguesonis]MBC2806586.1 M28 family peptidase [Rhizobium ruizarguesonis]
MIDTLLEMFSYQRPSGGATEKLFIAKYLKAFKADKWGNMVLKIGKNPRILFSSHMDTVHSFDGRNESLKFDGQFLTQTFANCLGADDTAGVFLMLELAKAKIEGVYVIHFGEEIGCVGSSALAKNNPDFFKDIDIAIAFDRMGYDDIITHQGHRRTASDAFALSLAAELGGSFKPSDKGVYTDTREYAHLVAECTNISVGYFKQHSRDEKQDIRFLLALREALLQVRWENLVVERQPADEEPWSLFSDHPRSKPKQPLTMQDLVWEYPEIAAEIISAMGLTVDDFLQTIEEQYGVAA